MRESIGTVSLLNFIIFFIFLVFAFLAGTFSYYKAYRVNNAMVAAIEKYEGFNEYAYNEIEDKLSSFGYERVSFNCPNNRGDAILVPYITKDGSYVARTREEAQNGVVKINYKDRGYCVYKYDHDSEEGADTDQYDSYEVVTIITFKFPVIEDLLKLRVSSRTRLIYNFEASREAMNK